MPDDAPKVGIITTELITFIREQFELDWHGIHGANHWARVRLNGLMLSKQTGANPKVVELFAFLHDSQRWNEGRDPQHGLRAASVARELHGRLFRLDEAELILLEQACQEHSDGVLDADITVQTCWDADRLDLGRVGKIPDPERLCTEFARQEDVIRVAYERSIAG
jgi:uncharacterized protein